MARVYIYAHLVHHLSIGQRSFPGTIGLSGHNGDPGFLQQVANLSRTPRDRTLGRFLPNLHKEAKTRTFMSRRL